ncbi:MAG: phosphoribosyltransferase [Bacteroidetes bacterium]|jgi:pyrimidine operon attenuation protein/uracil phosphoribosyltransferase|nr:phosphoribosyltransferase [Bacteroidota bacterium]
MRKTEILNATQIQQKLNRLAYEVYENNFEEREMLIAGIEGNGYVVAKRIYELLKKISKKDLKLGKITLNKKNPLSEEVSVDFTDKDFRNKTVILVDDVLNSGRTLIYGVKIFLDKPVKKLNTLILVDRSHGRFPVKADFVGLSLSTTLQEHIVADLSVKGKETVYLQ